MAQTSKVSLKLLIDRKGQRVLFAESGKDFVDFLFHLFSLPLGSVVGLLSKENMVGSLGKLYDSVENLNDTYIQPCTTKTDLLNPKILSNASINVPLLQASNSASSTKKKLYGCPNYSGFGSCGSTMYVADYPQAKCPSCSVILSKATSYVPVDSGNTVTKTEEGGYVKGVVTYMIMDDLQVKPMSSISSITLLTTFKVTNLGDLEEKVVYLSMAESLKLLKASLKSNTVLTDVFLAKKA